MDDTQYNSMVQEFFKKWRVTPRPVKRKPVPVEIVNANGEVLSKFGKKRVWNQRRFAVNAIYDTFTGWFYLSQKQEFLSRMISEGKISIRPVEFED